MDEPLRLLEADGSLAQGARGPRLDPPELLGLHSTLARARALDDALRAGRRRGEIALGPPPAGEEAVSLGASLALEGEDWIFACAGDAAALLHRGLRPEEWARLWAHGGAGSPAGDGPLWRRRRCVPFAGSAAARIPQAVGLVWASRGRGERTVALVSFGEATASHPECHVGLNLAGVFRAPVVLLCRARRGPALEGLPPQGAAGDAAARAEAYGLESARVAGWDLLAVRQAVGEAVERARGGGGATLVEAVVQVEGGAGPARADRDPLRLFRRYLGRKGLRDAAREEELARGAREEASRALADALRRGPAPPEALLEGVYDVAPPHLREQISEVRGRGGRNGG
jgi:TPP-dependent pyruvate/acetoin dehydrogenase alpha subunit